MVQKYLVGQYCKNEVFVSSKIVDDFGYNFLHHLMEKTFVHNIEVDFWYCFYYFFLFC